MISSQIFDEVQKDPYRGIIGPGQNEKMRKVQAEK